MWATRVPKDYQNIKKKKVLNLRSNWTIFDQVGALVNKKARQRRFLVDVFSASFFVSVFFLTLSPKTVPQIVNKYDFVWEGAIFRDFGKFQKNQFVMTFCIHFGCLLEWFGGFFGQNGAPEGVWECKFDKIGRRKNRSKKTSKNGGLLRVTVAVLVGPG